VDAADDDIGQPFPGEPGLSAAGERVGVGTRQVSGCEDGFAVADMPTGVRITEQLLVSLEEEQAVKQRDAGGGKCQVRHAPTQHDPRPRHELPALLLRADAGQVASNTLVQADDTLGELIYSGDQCEPHGSHDQGIFHQVLPLFVPNKTYD
jgi:hypothetical protein